MGKGARARKEREAQAGQISAKQQQEQKSKRLHKVIGWLAALVVLVLLVFGVLYSTGVLQRHMTAMTVGDTEISGSEYNYYYNQMRNNFLSQNSDYLTQLGLTYSTIDEAMYTDTQTFGEMFREQAETTLRDTYALYNEATSQGYEMSEEGQQSYDDSIAALESSAESADLSPNEYLGQALGMNLSFDQYKEILWRASLGQDFYNNTQAKESHTDEELNTYYEENADDFDKADYRVFQVFFETGETDEETEQNKAEAKAKADAFLEQVTDEESFIRLARENAAEDQQEQYAEDDGTLQQGVALTSSGTVMDWVKDPARQEGDAAVLEISTNYSVVYFIDRYRDESNTVNVRHILLSSDEDNDEEVSQQAEELLQQWKDGEQTEDSFAALARENSDDSNAAHGGLYEGVTPGQMVTEFNDWCFDESRQPGDTGIVKTEYGYHIMYFVSEGGPAWKVNAESALATQDYNNYMDELEAKYPSTTNQKTIDLLI